MSYEDNYIDIDVIAFIEDMFDAYNATLQEADRGTFLHGLIKDVVADAHKKESFPVVLLVEPIRNKRNTDVNSDIYKTVPIKLLIAAPTNWSDNSTEDIHATTLTVLNKFENDCFYKSLMKDLTINHDALNYNADYYTHYALVANSGNRKTTIFDKVSAIEVTFNLELHKKITCKK